MTCWADKGNQRNTKLKLPLLLGWCVHTYVGFDTCSKTKFIDHNSQEMKRRKKSYPEKDEKILKLIDIQSQKKKEEIKSDNTLFGIYRSNWLCYKCQPESSYRHVEGYASRTQIHWWELALQRNELTLHLLRTRFWGLLAPLEVLLQSHWETLWWIPKY